MKGATTANFTQQNLTDLFSSTLLNPLLKNFYVKPDELMECLIKALRHKSEINEEFVMTHNSYGFYIKKITKKGTHKIKVNAETILFLNIASYQRTGARKTKEGINMFYKYPIEGFALSKGNTQSNISDSYKSNFLAFFSVRP